jgi:SAM-dependent methyltransferase
VRRPINPAGFQAKFAGSDDPWACRTSRSEALKRRRALAGLPLAGTALDVACGDGAGTRDIAARALRTDAVDGSEAALASAARLIGDDPRVRLVCARLPDQLPRGRWRRIVVSELVYYLAPHQIVRLADALAARLDPGGVLIDVHHLVPFDDARTPPLRAVAILHDRLARALTRGASQRFGRYGVARWHR